VDAPDSQTTMIVTQGLSMSAGTAHPDAAWRWMDFLSQQITSQQGPFVQFLPARRSLAESSGFWDEVDEEMADALRYAIDHHYLAPNAAGYDAFFEALEAILSGEKPVEDALAEARKQTEAALGEAQAGQAEDTPVPTVIVASPEEEKPPAEGAVTIVFNPGLGALTNMQAYRQAAQVFHEAHPEIQVELEMLDFASSASINMQSIAESADCFEWTADIQNPENQAVILGLGPFLEADPDFTTDDFFPALLDKFTWQGQLWGLPAESQPYVIEYNKDLFDAAGVDYPALRGPTDLADVWATDDFFELAKALTRGEGDEKQYGFVPQYFEVNDLLLLMERRGARLIDEEVDPPAYTLDDPATVEALRWYAELSTEYGVKPVLLADIAKIYEANAFLIEREALVREGRAAMWTSEVLAIFGDRSELNTGVAPLPAGVGNVGASGAAFGLFISAQTEARQACWQWITFLTEQPGLSQGLPARRSVAESDAYRQRVGAERAAVYLASVAGAEQASVFDTLTGQGWLVGGLYWLGRAYSQVAAGEASVEEALDAAQKTAEAYRACVVERDAVSREKEWQACLLEVDPSIPAFLFNQGG